MSFNRRKMASEIKVSVVVVGDSKIGKTALIQQFTNKTFTEVREITYRLGFYLLTTSFQQFNTFLHNDGMLI